jgi:hypothetical protein
MKRMSTRTHGLIDYITGATLIALPGFITCRQKTQALLQAAGAAATAYSAVTKYERGMIKLMPMKTHLTLDALSGAMLLTSAFLMDDEDPAIRNVVAGIGLFEIAAAALTEPYAVADDAPDRRPSRARGWTGGRMGSPAQSMPQSSTMTAAAGIAT